MKITKSYLKSLIKEELKKSLSEGEYPTYSPEAFSYFKKAFLRMLAMGGARGAELVHQTEEYIKKQDSEFKDSPTGGTMYGSLLSPQQVQDLVNLSRGAVTAEDFKEESTKAVRKQQADADLERWRKRF